MSVSGDFPMVGSRNAAFRKAGLSSGRMSKTWVTARSSSWSVSGTSSCCERHLVNAEGERKENLAHYSSFAFPFIDLLDSNRRYNGRMRNISE